MTCRKERDLRLQKLFLFFNFVLVKKSNFSKFAEYITDSVVIPVQQNSRYSVGIIDFYLKNLKIFLWEKRRFRLRWDTSPGLSIVTLLKVLGFRI